MKEVILQLDSLENLKDIEYKVLDFNCVLIDERKLGLLLIKKIKFKKITDKEYAELFTKNIDIEKSLVVAIKNIKDGV